MVCILFCVLFKLIDKFNVVLGMCVFILKLFGFLLGLGLILIIFWGGVFIICLIGIIGFLVMVCLFLGW